VNIKPIETVYAGHHFRSRSEARWAILWDCLGVAFEYEPDCFEVGGRRYLPDFLLRRHGMFVEVKGVYPTDEEKEKCSDLARESGLDALIAIGSPKEKFQIVRFASNGEEYEGLWVIAWDKIPGCGMWLVREEVNGKDHASWVGPNFGARKPGGPMFSGALEEAYAVAGGARFETLSRFYRFPVLHWPKDRLALSTNDPDEELAA
jgi:hypothetical protein